MITRRAGLGRSRRSASSASLYIPSPTTGAVWSSPRTLETSITPRPLLRLTFRSPSRLRISRTTNGRRSSSTGAMRKAMLSRKSPSPATWSCTRTISSPCGTRSMTKTARRSTISPSPTGTTRTILRTITSKAANRPATTSTAGIRPQRTLATRTSASPISIWPRSMTWSAS